MRAFSTTLLALLLSAPLAPGAAQGGWVKDDFPEHGIRLTRRPRDYAQIPVQPGEEFIVVRYAGPEPAPEERRARAELLVIRIDHVPDPAQPPADEVTARDGPTRSDPRARGAPRANLPISTIERWVERRLGLWRVGEWQAGRERSGYPGRWARLRPTRAVRHAAGWIYAFERPGERTLAFLGLCDARDYDEQVRLWRAVAERASFSAPQAPDLQKLEQRYARRSLRDPAYRIRVRSQLVRGWKAEDTENYIVVYSTKDQPLLRLILRNIEAIREQYLRLFPPAAPIQAVSTLRVCANEQEYLLYGGQAGTAGYWNPLTEELVMYDAVELEDGVRPVDDKTFMVLYHEAFHQYVHYSAGALAPHSWFNEGTGDFFSGTRIKNGSVRGVGLNTWRAPLVRDAVRRGRFIPWKEILRYDQATFYRGDRRSLCYAQAWSMIYFLRTSRVVARRPEWARICDAYFEALQRSWTRGRADLAAEGKSEDAEALEQTRELARHDASWAAFQDVDLIELERAWVDFVLALELEDD